MQITLSSLLITLLIGTILILLFYLIITKRIESKFFRIDFLTTLIVIILLRLFILIEMPFTITIPLPTFMNPISDFLNYEFIDGIRIAYLLSFVWIIGSLLGFGCYIMRLLKLKELYKIVLEDCEKINTSQLLSENDSFDYPVYVSHYITAPMVLGFKKVVLLPDELFSEKELSNILLHEIHHIKSHDIYLKQFIKIVTIIYWWFPPIYLLQKEIDLFFELRADSKVTKSLSHYESLNYAETLVSVQRKVSTESSTVELFSTCLISENKKILSYRINYLLEGNFQKRTSRLVLFALLGVLILSNSIILEPAFYDAPIVDGTFEKNEFEYIIHHKDGSYSLVVDGQLIKINNINDSAFDRIKIIEEK